MSSLLLQTFFLYQKEKEKYIYPARRYEEDRRNNRGYARTVSTTKETGIDATRERSQSRIQNLRGSPSRVPFITQMPNAPLLNSDEPF